MTEQDVELVELAIQRKLTEFYPALRTDTPLMHAQELAKAAIAAMPNKHEKALAVAREALDYVQNTTCWSLGASEEELMTIEKALATIDEIVGKHEGN